MQHINPRMINTNERDHLMLRYALNEALKDSIY